MGLLSLLNRTDPSIDLEKQIDKMSKGTSYHRRGGAVQKVAGAKAGRPTRFYPADDVKVPKSKNVIRNAPKLRSSITPGTVLILLAGHFKGKRVVFMKQLESGLLLVTGPFNVNGVPMRRVNQAYVIATSTKVDLTGVKIDEKFNDAYFKRPAAKKQSGDFIPEKKVGEKKKVEAARAADQKAVDALLAKPVAAVAELKFYL